MHAQFHEHRLRPTFQAFPSEPPGGALALDVDACMISSLPRPTGVGRSTICDAIAAGARTASEIGVQLKAGTNCGSCIPEMKRLIAQTDSAPPAHEQHTLAATAS